MMLKTKLIKFLTEKNKYSLPDSVLNSFRVRVVLNEKILFDNGHNHLLRSSVINSNTSNTAPFFNQS